MTQQAKAIGARAYIGSLQEVQTPCYFYDMELLDATLSEALSHASAYGYRLHYAIKANHEERLVRHIFERGLGADCVSGGEVRRAVELGCPPSEIVFAGVAKSDAEIRYALEQEIFMFNVESLHELEVLQAIASEMGRTARVALRINPDVEPETHQYISTGQADSKFGIAYTEVDQVLASLPHYTHLRITGLHFHIGSQIRNWEAYRELCLRANQLQGWFAERGVPLKQINLGGGIGVNYDDPQAEPIIDFKAFFELIHNTLEIREGQTVHFELGRSLVAQCGELLTRVLYQKQTASGKSILLVDAGMTDLLRPALYGAKHRIENLTSTGEEHCYTVAGPVCESSDFFARDITLPTSQRGDLLTLRTAGAYGSSMASHYNLRELPEAIFSDTL